MPLDQSSFWENLIPQLLPSCAGLLSSRETFSSFPASPGADKSGRKKIAMTKFNFSLWVCSWALPEEFCRSPLGVPMEWGPLSPPPEHSGVAEPREVLHPMELCPVPAAGCGMCRECRVGTPGCFL